MIMRLSDSQSLDGLPHSDLEEDSSDEGVSDLSSQRNRMGSGGTMDLQAAANAYYAGKQPGNNNNKNKNVKK